MSALYKRRLSRAYTLRCLSNKRCRRETQASIDHVLPSSCLCFAHCPSSETLVHGILVTILCRLISFLFITRLTALCAIVTSKDGYRDEKRFRGGLVFKANRLVYHSTLGWKVIQEKKMVEDWRGRAGGADPSGRALSRIDDLLKVRTPPHSHLALCVLSWCSAAPLFATIEWCGEGPFWSFRSRRSFISSPLWTLFVYGLASQVQ